MLADLTHNDFDYIKNYSSGMRKCHEEEFVKQIDPALIRMMYRGKVRRDSYDTKYDGNVGTEDLLAFSRLFQGSNTVLPNLYQNNYLPLLTPKRNSDADSAALMTAILKHYLELNNAKVQNQEAVLNAWFFGFGVKKIGYRTVFLPKVDEPETRPDQGMLGKLRSAAQSIFGKPDNSESRERPELVDYETLFNDSENPMNVMLDHKADFLNKRAILHRIPRTLHDLKNYGDYEQGVLEEVEKRLQDKFGSRFDERETDLCLNEMHMKQRNGIWITTWLDEFEKPLRYVKSTYMGNDFLFSFLSLTNEPGVRYPTSHMKVASQVQKKLDNLANLYLQLIARSSHFIAYNKKALEPGQEAAMEKNLLRGFIAFKDKFSQQDLQSFQSGQVPADVERLMSMLQQNTTEILGSDEQLVSGSSKNETLGQDELARQGTKIRESGMQDRVADWMKEQFKKEGTLIKQFSNAELHIQITGKDYADPQTAENVEDRWISFMTETNPLGAKHYLQGDFEYNIDAEQAIRSNSKLQSEQLMEIIAAANQPSAMEAEASGQFRIRRDLLWKEWIKTKQGIGNPDRFIEKLDPLQAAAMQTQRMMMQGGIPQPQSNGAKVTKSTKQSSDGVTQTSSVEANS